MWVCDTCLNEATLMEGNIMKSEQLIKILRDIRKEAKKNNPDPDKIFFLADGAIKEADKSKNKE